VRGVPYGIGGVAGRGRGDVLLWMGDAGRGSLRRLSHQKKGEAMTISTSEQASAIGKLGRGRPKHYSEEEREKRRARLAEARKTRWPKKA